MTRYSALSLIRNDLAGNRGWPRAWRDPEPWAEYDVVIVGGGGHGLATAYYLAGIAPVWVIADPLGTRRRKKFVDLQNDVTLDDISLAHLEGYEAVEPIGCQIEEPR
jgi:hypothetical protein